jgi:hypothetical protein
MNRRFPSMLAAAALVLVACSESTSPAAVTDELIADDVAATSGSAIALDVQHMIGNESGGGFPSPVGPAGSPPDVTVSRSRTCYDASDAVQAACDAQTTAKVVIHMQVDGTVSDTTRDGGTFSGAIHRVRDETITGLLGTETSRTHNAVGTSDDTTSFSGSRGTRDATESSVDSVVNVVFNLPHSSNPWPISGQIIRNVEGSAEMTGANDTVTRTYTRRVVVTFNGTATVTIQVNDRSCTLNLATRRVTNCQ